MNGAPPLPWHLLIPGPLEQRTGGYLFDRRMVEGGRSLGCSVTVHSLAGRFPDVDMAATDAMGDCLQALPDDSLVVVDGLALGGLPDSVAPHARRLRLIALVHHPLADETGLPDDRRRHLETAESAALRLCRGVIATSGFTARRVAHMGVPAARIRVVNPGVTMPPPPAKRDGPDVNILCVATVIPRKGHDLLVDALARLRHLHWRCDCAGATDRDPAHVERIRARIEQHGLGDRFSLTGELAPAALTGRYEGADLFVLPSWYEGYGMVFTEAMSHGLPIITTTGGAIADTVPSTVGRLIPPGDIDALTDALRTLLTNRAERQRLGDHARRHAAGLSDWPQAAAQFVYSLRELQDG